MVSVAVQLRSYDELELYDVDLSRLAIEACVSISLHEDIEI